MGQYLRATYSVRERGGVIISQEGAREVGGWGIGRGGCASLPNLQPTTTILPHRTPYRLRFTAMFLNFRLIDGINRLTSGISELTNLICPSYIFFKLLIALSGISLPYRLIDNLIRQLKAFLNGFWTAKQEWGPNKFEGSFYVALHF